MRMNNVLETTGQDWANYLSHEVSGSGAIILVALLSGKPDAEILRQATVDLVALQPVLGCRFDDQRDPPVWVPTEDTDLFGQAEADDLLEGIQASVQTPMIPGRQMEVRLIMSHGQSALCLRLDHAATDGAGAKGCLALLNRCYNLRLTGGEAPEYIPSDRSERRVFERCGVSDPRLALRKETASPGPVATVPYGGTAGRAVRYKWCALPLSAVRRSGCTVNDRLLYAYAKALPCADGEGRVELHMTVDLRRFLEGEDAPVACNLSGMEAVSVPVSSPDTLENATAEIRRQTDRLKANRPGLSSAAMMAYLRKMPYAKAREILLDAGRKSSASGMAAPILSNLRLLCRDAMHFGTVFVTDILPLLPALHAPSFMLGAGSYLDTLILSAGFYGEERSADDFERFLWRIREELLKP